MLDVTDIARDIIGTILGLHNSKSYKLISSIQRHIHVISRTLIRDVNACFPVSMSYIYELCVSFVLQGCLHTTITRETSGSPPIL